MQVLGRRWYVVRVQPFRERIAQENLERQKFRVFAPSILKTVRHARKTRTVRAPLFPGYIFTQLDIERERWRSVNGTIGVIYLLTANQTPVPVPDGVVDELMLRLDDGVVRLDDGLREGMPVRILTGPFANMSATLLRLGDRERVEVLMELMGLHAPVSISRKALQKV